MLLLAGLAAVWLSAPNPAPRAAVTGPEPTGATPFDAKELRALEALRARLAQAPAPLPSEAVPGRSNAEALTYIADTSEDPRVIAAALRETLNAYASRGTQKPTPDAVFERVLLKHLASNDEGVVAAALSAARLPLMMAAPSQQVVKAVSDSTSAAKSAPRRAAALEALGLLRPDRRDAGVLSAFEQALSASEPYVLSLGLLVLSQSGPALDALPEEARARIAARVLELGAHADPGVRGRSLEVLSELERLVAAEPRLAAGQSHLADSDPYVRARATDLLLHCREPMAIHWLIEHTSDMAPARYELDGWTALDGNPGVLLHVVPGRQRVAEAALFAIQSLSQDVVGVNPLLLTLGGRPSPDALVLENREIARRWYAGEASRIPRQAVRGATSH
jgi:hypothetical protein